MSAPDEFAAQFAATGLNPEDYDQQALADAVAKLTRLMARLDAGDPEGEVPLFLFDPTRDL